MGNQSSSEVGGRTFGRSGNSLGLSRSELEKRCRPSGLYSDCEWDDKAIRKLVGDGKLASRMKGLDFASGDCNQECPICFLNYREINKTKCCGANICTECYLQVRPQKDKQACCPFCNAPKVGVTVAKKLSLEQVEQQKKEEQRVVEARKRSQSLSSDASGGGTSENNNFGSSLVAMERARSESIDASAGSENISPSVTAMPMSPQERQRLEAEMRAQLTHPLTVRVEAEATERRMENDRSYARSHRQDRWNRFRRRRGRGGGRDWNQIVDAFERGGNGQIHSLDDLVVLEAAILLSMGEEARSGGEQGQAFDPARHARDGFPLVRNYFANRGGNEETAESSSISGNQRPSAALDTAALLMRGISEEDQMAMAIAASLQDQGNGESTVPQEGEEEEEEEDSEDGQSRSSGSSFSSRGDDEMSEVAEDLEEDEYYEEYSDDDLSSDGEYRASGGDFDIEVDGGEEAGEGPLPAPESGDEDESYAENEAPEGTNTDILEG